MSLESLSGRQRQVAEGVGRAMTNKQIARELGVSPRTVEIHAAEAARKLGVKNRIALALAAHGIKVDPDGQA